VAVRHTLHSDACAFLFTRHYIGHRSRRETRFVISLGRRP
jgi:hypothetical protein